MLRTFECPQCGMPFVYRSDKINPSFAAVDHELWAETCLDNNVDRGEPDNSSQSNRDCPSQRCEYVEEAAEAVARIEDRTEA